MSGNEWRGRLIRA